jgi:hypothetical protein
MIIVDVGADFATFIPHAKKKADVGKRHKSGPMPYATRGQQKL